MAGIEKRRDYTPRSQRERQAYRLVLLGGGTGLVGGGTLVMALAGIMGLLLPIVLLLICAVSVWRFLRVTGMR